MTTTATIETVSARHPAGKHFFECVENSSPKHSHFGGNIATIEDMYGTNVLSAPRTVAAADVATGDPSFRIRHSRPSAGYEIPSRAEAVAHRPAAEHRPAASQPAPRLRLTRRGRAVLAALAALPVIVALVVMTLGGHGANATADLSTGQFEYVTVMAGQSLWELAIDLDPDADPRDVIYDVLQLNQLSSSQVHPGQRLAIPAAYTHGK